MTVQDTEREFKLAVSQEKRGDYQQARDAYQAALGFHSLPSPGWHFHLGRCCEKLRDIAGARDAYRHALLLDSRNANLHFRFWLLSFRMNKGSPRL